MAFLDGTGLFLGRVRCPVRPYPWGLCRSRQRHTGQSTEVPVPPAWSKHVATPQAGIRHPCHVSPPAGPVQPNAALPIPAPPGQDRAALRGGAGRRQHLHGSPHGPGQAAPAVHPGSELTPHPLTGTCHPAPASNTTPRPLASKPSHEVCARPRCRGLPALVFASSQAFKKRVFSMGLGG